MGLGPLKQLLSIVLNHLDVDGREDLDLAETVVLLQLELQIVLRLYRSCRTFRHVLRLELFEVLLPALFEMLLKVFEMLLHGCVEFHALLFQAEVVLMEVLRKAELQSVRLFRQLLQRLLLEDSLPQLILSHVLCMLVDHKLVSIDLLLHLVEPFVNLAELSLQLLLVEVDELNERELLGVYVLVHLLDRVLDVVCDFALAA